MRPLPLYTNDTYIVAPNSHFRRRTRQRSQPVRALVCKARRRRDCRSPVMTLPLSTATVISALARSLDMTVGQ